LFLYFEYVFFKLFDFNARDYYNINNPVVKILNIKKYQASLTAPWAAMGRQELMLRRK